MDLPSVTRINFNPLVELWSLSTSTQSTKQFPWKHVMGNGGALYIKKKKNFFQKKLVVASESLTNAIVLIQRSMH